jgi:hypothetical protein
MTGIDARYCPPLTQGPCTRCNRWSARRVTRWIGVVLTALCTACHLEATK